MNAAANNSPWTALLAVILFIGGWLAFLALHASMYLVL